MIISLVKKPLIFLIILHVLNKIMQLNINSGNMLLYESEKMYFYVDWK